VLHPVLRDELLLEGKLAPTGAGVGLPAVIPEGMRAVSIRVDDVVAVAGFVGPGTRVDVLLTGDPNRGRSTGSDETLTKTILENVQVLAAGQKVQPDAQGKPEKVNVVTLLCTPEDAAKVTLAANEGRIQLVLRNPADTGRTDQKATVVRQALYSGSDAARASAGLRPVVARRAAPRPVPAAMPEPVAATPPPPPPPTTATITIIRAETVTKVEVPIAAAS
jgi:pilus assembly protein CpaB